MNIDIQKIELSEFDLSLSEIRIMHYGRALKVEQSMKLHGQLQPMVVRVCKGSYQLIDGFKQYYAAEVLTACRGARHAGASGSGDQE